jgi:catechol 2,3-dioxygenase
MTEHATATAGTTSPVRADLIAAGTEMDAVTLRVGDLDGMTAYYRDVLALQVLDTPAPADDLLGTPSSASVTLGRAGTPLVVLRHTPNLPVPGRREAGLFHTAILFDEEPALAATVASIAMKAPGTYTGSADHLVSKAFYFTDPEGNGIELYWDRSRDQWAWDNGFVKMDSLRLDPNEYLREHVTDEVLAGVGAQGAAVGHVHLQVGDVEGARRFYVDTLGFEVTATWPGALFVAAGGYHHHLAMNTWNSAGAGPRASSLGLGEVSIVVPTADDVAALTSRLAHAGVAVTDDGAALRFQDPWRNLLKVTADA